MATRGSARRSELAAQIYLCQQQQLREWIQLLLQRSIGEDLSESLANGVVLCEVIRTINASLMPGIKDGHGGTNLENISNFIAACQQLGVVSSALFDVSDLTEKKNMSSVVRCLLALSAQVRDHRYCV